MTIATGSPKASKPRLVPYPGYYAVANGPLFDYYPISLGKASGGFVEMVKAPTVFQEGYATIGKDLYLVTLKDLTRRRINVRSNPVRVGNETVESDNTDSTSVTSDSSTSTRTDTQLLEPGHLLGNKPGISEEIELQVSQDADLAWKEQINTLLFIEDPEAEWELVEVVAQPKQSNESSAVPVANEAA